MEPLKNLYSEQFFEKLTGAIAGVYPAFDRRVFLANIYDDDWDDRELKARMRHITITLHDSLPPDYRTALDIITRASLAIEGGFGTMVFPDFVELYGLEDWDASIPALELFTQQCSSEFAVRPFILGDQDRMMAQMLTWSTHESEHVRRLASEGCRPRLPWAIALPAFKADPAPILPVLENLKLDSSEYVRRSVANNLNDIAKDNPDVVIDLLRRWQQHDTDEMRWIINHALRTLIKQGNVEALELIGYPSDPQVEIRNLAVDPLVVSMGEEVTFSFEVVSTADTDQNLMIDYVLHLMRSNGKHTQKVFKLTQKTLAPGEAVQLTRRYSFKPITTRKYYPGQHMIQVQINGQLSEEVSFELTE